MITTRVCPECSGEDDDCRNCEGFGSIMESETPLTQHAPPCPSCSTLRVQLEEAERALQSELEFLRPFCRPPHKYDRPGGPPIEFTTRHTRAFNAIEQALSRIAAIKGETNGKTA